MAKVLLVEDDNNLREIYEARLQAEGYDIMSAQDGEEALVLAKKSRPDIIISDVMMPRVSGFEMLDILRNTEGLRDVKVIMLTALGQAEDRSRAGSLGADRYLVKSQVTLEDIVKATQELLVPDKTTDTEAKEVVKAAPAATIEEAPAPAEEPKPTEPTQPAATPTPPSNTTATPTPAPAPANITPPKTIVIPVTTAETPVSAPAKPPTPPVTPPPAKPPASPTLPKPAIPPATPLKTEETHKPSAVLSAAMSEKDKKTAAAGLTLPGVATVNPEAHQLSAEDETRAQIASFTKLNSLTNPGNEDTKANKKPVAPEEKPATVSPAKPTPEPATAPATTDSTNTVINNAINDLIQDANKQADAKGGPTTTEPEPEKKPAIVTPPASANNEVKKEDATNKPSDVSQKPENKTTPETAEQKDNDAVPVAHKKVIEPLSESFATDDAKDLNALLAKEGHDMTETDDAQNDTAIPHFATAAHPPGHVFSPDTSKDKA